MNTIVKVYCRAFQFCFRLAIPVLPYRDPEVMGSVGEVPGKLRARKIGKVLIVTDAGVKNAGLLTSLEAALDGAGIGYSVFDRTVANPTVRNVEEAREQYIKEGCQALVGFGGGSAIDCAKAVGARIARPHKSIGRMGGILKILLPIPYLVAVPTTAGTGSEVTLAAVITDSDTGRKFPVNDFPLIPKLAVLDPENTKSLPKHMVSTTGMDALTHAVEAYIGSSTTKDTRADALEAVRLIFADLERAYLGGDEESRRNMLTAAYLAGRAFSKSYVGYIHAVAHSLGGAYNIPHGLANAVLMPIVLDYYGEAAYKKLHELAVAAGIAAPEEPDRDAAERFIAEIRDMNARMGIPEKLEGIRTEDVPKLARNAAKEANPLYPVPVLMDAGGLEKIYYKVMDRGDSMDIETLLEKQRVFFASGATLSVEYRVEALKKLREAVKRHEKDIEEALKADLGKSDYEGFMCESGLALTEITWMINHVRVLSREKTVATPLAQFASRSYIKPVPYGNVLIMSPWNYPFLLTVDPLADAIAAGNTAVLKPSAYSPATSRVVAELVSECFPPEYVSVITGGREENKALLEQKFDMVFFTGSQAVGREVLRRCAERLIPAVLELGGKSPCIVDATADLKLAARRIVFGKYLNCGQTCVAPDYILCDRRVKDRLVSAIKVEIVRQYGEKPLTNPDYGKIVNQKHFDRLLGLIDRSKVVLGGESSPETLQIAPTVMSNVTWDDAVMGEEIFGPILPVLSYDDFEDIFALLRGRQKPLALYIFSRDKSHISAVTSRIPYGGGCVNDVVIHLATSAMPFGGVGESGMGAYHGARGFEAFSHRKSIVDKKTWIDLPMRYQPYARKLYGPLLRIFLR